MLELRTQSKRQPAVKERNLVLHETTIDMVGKVARQEIDRRDGLHNIRWTHARAHPPEKVLLPGQSQMMEEVDVEGVTSLTEFRLEVVCAVKVSLNLEV